MSFKIEEKLLNFTAWIIPNCKRSWSICHRNNLKNRFHFLKFHGLVYHCVNFMIFPQFFLFTQPGLEVVFHWEGIFCGAFEKLSLFVFRFKNVVRLNIWFDLIDFFLSWSCWVKGLNLPSLNIIASKVICTDFCLSMIPHVKCFLLQPVRQLDFRDWVW